MEILKRSSIILISVIIPTYNRSLLLKEAIDSVLNQTYQSLEVLIIDDYSDDNTEKVVKSYKDARVKYFLNKRSKGAQGARNTGLSIAKGEWVALLDSDDIWLPTKLEKQVKYLKNAVKAVGLATGKADYDFESNKILKSEIPHKTKYTTEDLIYKNYLGGFSTFIFKKEKALEIGGFDERFSALQDRDFYVSLSIKGELHNLKEVLAYIRIKNRDRITLNFNYKLSGSENFYQKHNKLIKNNLHAENRLVLRMLIYGWEKNRLKSLRHFHWLIISLFINPSYARRTLSYILRAGGVNST
ncbi:MAG: glycosyltransferase family A protein [Balneolales bacterium]